MLKFLLTSFYLFLFSISHTGVRYGKKGKDKKKSKEISALWFSFTQDTSTLCRCMQNLKTLALLGAEKSLTKNFIGEKK